MKIGAHKNIPFIIAVDGPSASGKGTVARLLAAHYGFAHLDTGLLYRAVGLAVLQQKLDPNVAEVAESAAKNLNPAMVAGIAANPALRAEATSAAASKVAQHAGVRAALLKFQQDFCATPPNGVKGAVLDGRDIGTVIAPHAPVKLYITASDEARAERRFKELQEKGGHDTYAQVLGDLKERDARDATRSVAPTKPADDAVVIDTTAMNIEAVFAKAVAIVQNRMGS